jgi:hypothetical protein
MKLKTIKYKGRDYVQVNSRVEFFNENYKLGKIETNPTFNEKTVSFRAVITPDISKPERFFTGHSFGVLGVEKALEKLETVAVGRALAFMGIGIVDGIASAEEMDKFQNSQAVDKLQTKLSFEAQVEAAQKGELKCLECASPVVVKEGKDGSLKLYCEKDWKHKRFISKAEHQELLKKSLNKTPF